MKTRGMIILFYSKFFRKYFGIQFGGGVFTYNTLSFDWKSSTYIYQTIGMQVTNYLRNKSIYNIQYIDDRLVIEFVSLG